MLSSQKTCVNWSRPPEQRRVTDNLDDDANACHEAGHAVAALIRSCELGSVTIEPTDHTLGLTLVTPRTATDRSFVIFAGPWADARSQWPLPTLDGEHYGKTFEESLKRAFWREFHGDGHLYMEALGVEDDQGVIFDREGREWFWSRDDLEPYWPVIQAVAEILIRDRTVTGEAVRHVYESMPPTARTEQC
jgi:hypothetical protein